MKSLPPPALHRLAYFKFNFAVFFSRHHFFYIPKSTGCEIFGKKRQTARFNIFFVCSFGFLQIFFYSEKMLNKCEFSCFVFYFCLTAEMRFGLSKKRHALQRGIRAVRASGAVDIGGVVCLTYVILIRMSSMSDLWAVTYFIFELIGFESRVDSLPTGRTSI